MTDELEEQIMNSRNLSSNGSVVVYDLTTGVDFSQPAKTAKALAQVFFKEDAIKWFKVHDYTLKFDPKYKARIIFPIDIDKKVLMTAIKDFELDMSEDELKKTFKIEYNNAGNSPDGHFYDNLGAILYVAYQRHKQRKEFLADLLDEVIRNTEFIKSDRYRAID